MKLTKPQHDLLERLSRDGQYRIASKGVTRALLRRNLAAKEHGCVCITQAGRDILKKTKDERTIP